MHACTHARTKCNVNVSLPVKVSVHIRPNVIHPNVLYIDSNVLYCSVLCCNACSCTQAHAMSHDAESYALNCDAHVSLLVKVSVHTHPNVIHPNVMYI